MISGSCCRIPVLASVVILAIYGFVTFCGLTASPNVSHTQTQALGDTRGGVMETSDPKSLLTPRRGESCVAYTQASLAAGFDFSKRLRRTANPHMPFTTKFPEEIIVEFIKHIKGQSVQQGVAVRMLDVGGNAGTPREQQIANMVEYTSLDFTTPPVHTKKKSVIGNIMHYNPMISDCSYEIVSAFNVFEHLVAPWKAAEEMKRVTTNGGFIIILVPFSWRYHAYPLDTLRYTHTELRYLFESLGGIKTLMAGYHYRGQNAHGHMPGRVDEPPTKDLQQNEHVLWIGQRLDNVTFDPESLDHNSEFPGTVAAGLP